MMSIEAKLIDLGGEPWERGSRRRIHLNNWLEIAGYRITRYRSGAISSAHTPSGDKISNVKATELSVVTVFWDCNEEKLVLQGWARMLNEARVALIEALGLEEDANT
ncbi:hypothetical protein [Marinimicrobium sp. ABcell2]|uniref:hypothetical protein n=1 Tax=Marinimicrobium sp. ABcell2 TaxID=3069751 RepID=UPI0027B63729|nr:hypothetical protein [Marinimicrobium sp. ABcell2]MDQ2077507.1 hypothetical protein [Marinimicrobium sp. ABcell2]